jgi:predicted Fe-Mo cluster-binding NifX family protein
MKIALPSNGSEIDAHFGHCQCFTIFSVDDDNKITSEETLTPPSGCGCKSSIVPQLADMGVSVMLAGNMGGGAVNVLANNGIKVVRGCAGDVREVAQAWLAGNVNDSGASCKAHGDGGCSSHS